eukprot:1048759-Prorocentrum_minimum.AAC.1
MSRSPAVALHVSYTSVTPLIVPCDHLDGTEAFRTATKRGGAQREGGLQRGGGHSMSAALRVSVRLQGFGVF